MTDRLLSWIPVDPRLVPPSPARAAALACYSELGPRADRVDDVVSGGVELRDCGARFERVRCPSCGETLAVPAWQRLMDADFAPGLGFSLIPLRLPCCAGNHALNDLVYEAPQGFSRYALRALNPRSEANEALNQALEALVGCRLRVIDAHY
jgi:hypothetical protein